MNQPMRPLVDPEAAARWADQLEVTVEAAKRDAKRAGMEMARALQVFARKAQKSAPRQPEG